MNHWRRVLLGLLFVLLLVPAVPANAGATIPPELNVTFTSSAATAEYPKGITFSLDYDTDEPIERVELFYTASGEETLNLVTPKASDVEAGTVSYFLDLQIYYVPPGIDLVYFWRLTGEDGSTAETERTVASWVDTRFNWSVVETDDVRVMTYDGNPEFARAILESAQSAVDQIQVELNAELDQQVRIWAYRSTEDFAGTQAPNSEQWIAGVAYPTLKVILAVLPPGDYDEVGRVVPHEISHQVIHQAIDNPYTGLPTWLDEGIAVTYQENGFSQFPELVQEASDQGALFSVRALNSGFPFDGGGATLGYAQSFSIVTFIKDYFGADALASLVDAYKAGVSHDEAAISALGVDLDELDRLWKESLGYKGDSGTAGVVDTSTEDPSPWGNLLASGALIWVAIAAMAILVAGRSIRQNRTQDPDDPLEFSLPGPG
jgi:hypothetical protein